jgi:hypothetical protein
MCELEETHVIVYRHSLVDERFSCKKGTTKTKENECDLNLLMENVSGVNNGKY